MRRGHVSCFVTLGALVWLGGCARPSAIAPAEASPAAPGAAGSVVASQDAVVYPLVAGTFSIESAAGDGLFGTHAGAAHFPAGGGQYAAIILTVTGGSGEFAGATGSVTVTGSGAFADEGPFSLGGSGIITRAGGKPANLVVNLRGSSLAGCSAQGLIAVSQTASGTVGRIGRVEATLLHEVEQTGCVP